MSEELKITGHIIKVQDVESGTSKNGKEWQKLSFIVDTKSEYNNIYSFEIFGSDKVEKFNKWNKEGSKVTVSFNVNCREYKGKFYTSLMAWNIFNEFSDAPTEAEKERKSKNLLDDGVGKAPALEQDATYSQDDLPF